MFPLAWTAWVHKPLNFLQTLHDSTNGNVSNCFCHFLTKLNNSLVRQNYPQIPGFNFWIICIRYTVDSVCKLRYIPQIKTFPLLLKLIYREKPFPLRTFFKPPTLSSSVLWFTFSAYFSNGCFFFLEGDGLRAETTYAFSKDSQQSQHPILMHPFSRNLQRYFYHSLNFPSCRLGELGEVTYLFQFPHP